MRERLSYANVMATIAVFIALGAGAYAVGLPKNSVKSKQIKNGAVALKDLGANSVDSSKVLDGTLLGADFATGQLPAGQTGAAGPPLFVDVLQGGNFTGTPPNDGRGCTVATEWRECGPVTVNVPANRTYKVAIDGAGSFFAFGASNFVRICASARRSTETFETTAPLKPVSCANHPTGIALSSGDLASAATNGIATLTGGASGTNWVVSTAVRPNAVLSFCNGCDFTTLHTTVTVAQVP